jgi:hypothetical protein
MLAGRASLDAIMKFDIDQAIASLEARVARFLEEIANGKDKS